jgi:hypothetical protein
VNFGVRRDIGQISSEKVRDEELRTCMNKSNESRS